MNLAQEEMVALICAKAEPWHFYSSLIADALTIPISSSQPPKCHNFAAFLSLILRLFYSLSVEAEWCIILGTQQRVGKIQSFELEPSP